MSLRGEQALKDGLSFEFAWTTRHLIEVLGEDAVSIQMGGRPSETGVDFILIRKEKEEHHQVKRALGTKGEWTIASLAKVNVLEDFKRRLSNPLVECHFVSTLPSLQLGELAKRARSAKSFDAFTRSYLDTSEYRNWFEDLTNRWRMSEEKVWQFLQRVKVRHTDEDELRESCIRQLKILVKGSSQNAWAHLRDSCFDEVHKSVTASDLWRILEQKGIERQVFDGDPRLLSRIEKQTSLYLDRIRHKLIKPPLTRQLTSDILTKIADSDEGEDIVLLGAPGGGKSTILSQIVESWRSKGLPVLAIRLDEIPSDVTVKAFQDHLDLPIPPARALSLAAAGKPALFVVDQLDAVSEYSGRTGALFDRVASTVLELRDQRVRSPVHVIIACREVDWRYDGRLRQLHGRDSVRLSDDKGVHRVTDLTDEEIAILLRASGLDINSFSPRQRDDLLRRPQYLAVFIELRPQRDELSKIITPKLLFDCYWERKQREMSREFRDLSLNPWVSILQKITNKLSETALSVISADHADQREGAPLSVSKRFLEDGPAGPVDWMLSNGVLSENRGRIRFGHESFFDYCFARFFDERKQTLFDYLLASDQTLIQRGQVRQVLAYQNDEDPHRYFESISRILGSGKIRFHIQQLVIAVACETAKPSQRVCELFTAFIDQAIIDLNGNCPRTLAAHALGPFLMSAPFFEFSCKNGYYYSWLIKSQTLSRIRLFQAIIRHQKLNQATVWNLISKLSDLGGFEQDLNSMALSLSVSESRETFDWILLRMVPIIKLLALNEHDIYKFDVFSVELSKDQPRWFSEWLGALILARAEVGTDLDGDLVPDHAVKCALLMENAADHPADFVRNVLDAVFKHIEITQADDIPAWTNYSFVGGDSVHYRSADEGLFDALVKAIHLLVEEDFLLAESCLKRLGRSEIEALKKLCATALCLDHPRLTGLAADSCTSFTDAFCITDNRGQLAFRSILSVHARRFDAQQLAEVENVFLNCYPKWQNGINPYNQFPCMGTLRGSLQQALLSSIPRELLSHAGKRRLDELDRKFDSLKLYFKVWRPTKPLDSEVAANWKPEAYLSALRKTKSRLLRSWRNGFPNGRDLVAGMVSAIKARPQEFIDYLEHCTSTDKEFVETIAQEVAALKLPDSAIFTAIKRLHAFGTEFANDTVRLIEKLDVLATPDSWELLVFYAFELPAPSEAEQSFGTERVARLFRIASESPRGRAMEIVKQVFWKDPLYIDRLVERLPTIMRDNSATIRVGLAGVCYAIATSERHRSFGLELFQILVNERCPDEHVLASYWSVKFMQDGMRHHWEAFRPIVARMVTSTAAEVCAAGGRLSCMAVYLRKDAEELADSCLTSPEPKVRREVAMVIARNFHVADAPAWSSRAFLTLSNDLDKEVCRAISSGFTRERAVDFRSLSAFVMAYVQTKAFSFGASHFIDALVESPYTLPDCVFDIVEAMIHRLDEPRDLSENYFVYHVREVCEVVKRLYHESQDGELRRKALDFVDTLCRHGAMEPNNIDS